MGRVGRRYGGSATSGLVARGASILAVGVVLGATLALAAMGRLAVEVAGGVSAAAVGVLLYLDRHRPDV